MEIGLDVTHFAVVVSRAASWIHTDLLNTLLNRCITLSMDHSRTLGQAQNFVSIDLLLADRGFESLQVYHPSII